MRACTCGRPTVREDGTTVIHFCAASNLHRAALDNNTSKLRQLLAAGAAVNKKDDVNGCSPLHFACLETKLAAVEILLEFHADTNLLSHDGSSCLHLATKRGGSKIVQLLLEHGGTNTVNTLDLRGSAPLHIASDLGYLQIVLDLLAAGADILKCQKTGSSALHLAARSGHPDIVRVLLKAGADVNHANDDGVTALMGTGDLSCVRLLLDAGATVNSIDGSGSNALHYAGFCGFSAAVICSLYKAGCDPTAFDDCNETPADVARRLKKEDAAALLERLAEDAPTKCRESRNVGSDSNMISNGDTEAKGSPKELETELPASIERDDTIASRKILKTCAHCGVITHTKCAGCRSTHYCSRDCQRATYAQHKELCVVLCEKRMEA